VPGRGCARRSGWRRILTHWPDRGTDRDVSARPPSPFSCMCCAATIDESSEALVALQTVRRPDRDANRHLCPGGGYPRPRGCLRPRHERSLLGQCWQSLPCLDWCQASEKKADTHALHERRFGTGKPFIQRGQPPPRLPRHRCATKQRLTGETGADLGGLPRRRPALRRRACTSSQAGSGTAADVGAA
jgi:hypothetical protein